MLGTRGVRFQDPSAGNSSPWIYVWCSWAVVACTSFVLLRIWVRRGRFGLDDVFNLLGCVSGELDRHFEEVARGLMTRETDIRCRFVRRRV